MAILGKIREKSIVLILVIGMALFAFVISGVFDGAGTISQEPVAIVGDEEITIEQFSRRVDAVERNTGMSNVQAANTVWNQIVTEYSFNQLQEELGLEVGRSHVENFIANSPGFRQDSRFQNALGEFDTMAQTLNDDLDVMFSNTKEELHQEQGEGAGQEALESLVSQVDTRLSGSPVDVKELQSRVNGLKSRLSSFGSINMKAVEIYDKLNEEFTALLEKREKLNVEKAEILDFVSEMDEKKKERFMETFDTLKDHFVSIYSKLSSKGDAELVIENEKDLFNSGVEIKVRLSRNNFLDIKSLSGGEKTITAVAFIFAVQEFNPASFYIFDEIDAALDIMNCEKLGKLIAASAHKAQYVVVSHSEYLIQSSQSIYGVTMDPNKISGVVSLDLKDAKEMVDEGEEVA